ncbi:hypothetical protein EMIT0210MI2_11023 [Priestia megaterium]
MKETVLPTALFFDDVTYIYAENDTIPIWDFKLLPVIIKRIMWILIDIRLL